MAFKRILCAIDFSLESVDAFHVAVEVARQYSGSLHLFHVIEAQPVVSEWPPTDSMGKVTIEIVEKANAAMESLVASAESSLVGLSFTTEVTSGLAVNEIVNRAQEWKADLTVLGSKGAASLEDIIVGSTAEGVMKRASGSVLIARPPQAEAQDQ